EAPKAGIAVLTWPPPASCHPSTGRLLSGHQPSTAHGPQPGTGCGPRASELGPNVQIVLPAVAVERGRNDRALVVRDRRVVGVERVHADAQLVGRAVAQRDGKRAEIVPVGPVRARETQ